MPPVDKSDQSVARYFTRILTALTLQAGGELRIPLKCVRQVESESERRVLLEDTNLDTDELVLRFGSKHSAVYPVEPDTCASQKPPSPSNSEPLRKSRPPLTLDQLNQLDRTIKAKKAAAILRQDRQRSSSNPSELNFPDLENQDEQTRGQT